MNFEYQMLTIMTIIYLFAWLPTSLGKFYSFGGNWIRGNREPLPGKELLPWAGRCERALDNLKYNFPAFIVAILALGQLSKFDEGTKIAAGLYVVGRILHYLFYGLGIVPMRFLTFVLAISCNLYLLIKILL